MADKFQKGQKPSKNSNILLTNNQFNILSSKCFLDNVSPKCCLELVKKQYKKHKRNFQTSQIAITDLL